MASPSSGPTRKGTGTAKPPKERLWPKVRVQYARLSYRDSEKQDWKILERSYWPARANLDLPEAFNVEQVNFTSQGIEMRQGDKEYSPQVTERNRKFVTEASCSWILQFQKMSNIILSEYTMDNRTYGVIRFICAEPPVNRSEIDTPEDMEEAQDDEVAADVDVDQMETSETNTLPDPSSFPLAALCKDANSVVGKEFRLGFMRKTARPKESYAFIWPAVVQYLGGLGFVYNAKQEGEYRKPLDAWAVANRESLQPFRLEEYRSEDSGRLEWHLRPKETQSVFDLLIGAKEASISPRQAPVPAPWPVASLPAVPSLSPRPPTSSFALPQAASPFASLPTVPSLSPRPPVSPTAPLPTPSSAAPPTIPSDTPMAGSTPLPEPSTEKRGREEEGDRVANLENVEETLYNAWQDRIAVINDMRRVIDETRRVADVTKDAELDARAAEQEAHRRHYEALKELRELMKEERRKR
ncbi:MAG: hypothetical protein Q9191_003789 [Dirinaria sp. TL-2023a]